jgi:hypothetical protein
MTDVDNIYTNLGGYFELSFIIVGVDNLDTKLAGYLCIFHSGRGG